MTQNNPTEGHESKKAKSFSAVGWVILAGIVLTVVMMFLPREKEVIDPSILPWNSVVNAQGQVEALGLTLDKSTPKDALKEFGYDYEVQVFTDKKANDKSAEFYFPTMTLARLRGVVTLVLDVPSDELDEMYNRGVKITVNTVGNRQVTLLDKDAVSLMDKKIHSMTFVPKNNLTPEMVEFRFGKPASKKVGSDGLARWAYPKKGLEIILNPEGPEVLQYYRVQ